MTAEPIDYSKITNILIIRLSSIGDVLKCTVVIDKLREQFPNARLSWLVETKSQGVLLGNSNIDEIIVWKRKEWSKEARTTRNYGSFARQLYDFIQEIRQRRFDLVIDLHGLPRSGIVSYLSGAPLRLCYTGARKYSHLWANCRVTPNPEVNTTVMKHYAGLLAPLRINSHNLHMQMPILPEDRAFAGAFLKESGLRAKSFVILNPSTSWQSKCWPVEYFACLANMITEKYRLPIVITGSLQDVPLVQNLIKQMHCTPIDVSGKTTLRQLAALSESAGIFISGDTGPLFIAEAVGAATISIFGPTEPDWHAPQGKNHFALSTGSCQCSKSFCENKICLTEIKPEQVFAAFEALAQKVDMIR